MGSTPVRVIRTRSLTTSGIRMRVDHVKGSVDVSNGGGESPEDLLPSSPGTRSAMKRRVGKIVGERSSSQLLKRKNGVVFGESNGKCRSPPGQSRRKKALSSACGDGDRGSVALVSNSRSDSKSVVGEELVGENGSDLALGDLAGEEKSGEGIEPCDGEIEKCVAQFDAEKPGSDAEKEDDDDKCGSEDRTGDGDINGSDAEENEEEEEVDEEIEVETISCDEKKMVEDEEKIKSDEEIVDNISDCEDKEMDVAQVDHPASNFKLNSKPKFSPKPTISTVRNSSSIQFSPVKKQPPKFSRPTHSTPGRDCDGKEKGQTTHSTLQSLVDLVMWKHVPKSTLVFGVGTFLIISSSYTKDLNISFISVTSYLGLIYLGISFLYKSFKYRGIKGGSHTSYSDGMVVIGEEEAIWLSRFILPVLNEFLLKLKALFCGDPAVTMKLAAVLFALARCGSSITLWNMVKLGFFAAFILPKFCSSYSAQITGYGKFWILRFQDAWRTCSHKKVVASAIFTIVWNLSSVVARTWAAFMLFVAIRYYQQSSTKAECSWVEVEDDTGAASIDIHALRRKTQLNRKLKQGRPITNTPVHLKEAKKFHK